MMRHDIRTTGESVIRLYDEHSEVAKADEQGVGAAFGMLGADGGTPPGARGMGGITKHCGVASHPHVARATLEPTQTKSTRRSTTLKRRIENGVPWRYLGCLFLLSTSLWMLVENAWKLLHGCCLFLETFWFLLLGCY